MSCYYPLCYCYFRHCLYLHLFLTVFNCYSTVRLLSRKCEIQFSDPTLLLLLLIIAIVITMRGFDCAGSSASEQLTLFTTTVSTAATAVTGHILIITK